MPVTRFSCNHNTVAVMNNFVLLDDTANENISFRNDCVDWHRFQRKIKKKGNFSFFITLSNVSLASKRN